MDRIALRGIRAMGRHGVTPQERAVPQPFDVDVIVHAELGVAAAADALEATIDYAALHARVVDLVSTTSFALIERLASVLLDAVFEDPRAMRAEVTVAKPGLLDGATPSVTLERARVLAYVGIGSNLGDAPANVRRAAEALASVGRVVRQSRQYRTQPWGKTDQPAFVNAVVQVETTLPPLGLLGALKAIETRLGRVPGERWGPRTIDLDLLTYGAEAIDRQGLRVPHVHLRERAFVLVPLAEIDEGYAAARDALAPSERAGVVPI